MNTEQRKAIQHVLMGHTETLNTAIVAELDEMTGRDVLALEPLIDEMIRQAKEQTDIEEIGVPFHAAVQLLAFLKFHEWREARPGYHDCPECKIEFAATPDNFRRHRDRCRVGQLIKFLQAKIGTHEGSNAMAFPNTRDALEAAGYRFKETKVCPSCNVTIEMFDTPRGAVMPLDFKQVDGVETCEPHFASCKNPELYSRRLREKKEKEKAAAAGAGPMSPNA